jgi:hypothetical protein
MDSVLGRRGAPRRTRMVPRPPAVSGGRTSRPAMCRSDVPSRGALVEPCREAGGDAEPHPRRRPSPARPAVRPRRRRRPGARTPVHRRPARWGCLRPRPRGARRGDHGPGPTGSRGMRSSRRCAGQRAGGRWRGATRRARCTSSTIWPTTEGRFTPCPRPREPHPGRPTSWCCRISGKKHRDMAPVPTAAGPADGRRITPPRK